jgi:IS30 family transposase
VHVGSKVMTDIDVQCFDRHALWQRGTNKYTNQLLRKCLPRSTDLATVTAGKLDQIAAELHERPRETLGGKTPAKKFGGFLAVTV